ncbi:MAG: hypothetical protein GXP02_04500 [Alphaproteobacteria bacterium]|nr:hypothetical protein [Alphaproteobacteria bacterium]
MSYRNAINHGRAGPGLITVIFTVGSLLSFSASAATRLPGCGAIVRWAAAANKLDKNIILGNFWGGVINGKKVDGKYLMSGFMDKLFKPTFDTTFDQWSNKDLRRFRLVAKNCSARASKAGWAAYNKRNYQASKIYNGAVSFIGMIGVTTPSKGIDSYSSIIRHQRKLYPRHKKALMLKNKQLATAKAMSPSKANIDALAVMARNPQFIYLRPGVRKNHTIALQNQAIILADRMVENARAKFSSFPRTLKGLKQLQAFRVTVQKDLQGIRSRRWNDFNQAYIASSRAIAAEATDEAIAGLDNFSDGLDGLKKLLAYREKIQTGLGQVRTSRWNSFEKAYATTLNRIAATAVNDFKGNLARLPASVAGLQQVRASIGNLFKYRPAPANLKDYQGIARERARTMRQDIRKIACYKQLETAKLDAGDRDSALLGPKGETTLGLLICDLNNSGYKFQQYDSAGWFGSSSTLSLLSPRGITLAIEMKKVEAVKNKEMLVGVMVKDATSETKLTLTGWQDYILKLTRGRRY